MAKAKAKATAKSKAHKLDMKVVLSALDRKDMNFYSNLSDDEKKSFEPWVMMRMLSSCTDPFTEHYLLMVNDFVNCDFNVICKKHPELMWKLLAMCGVGKKQFHPWIRPGRRKGKNKVQEFLSVAYPNKKQYELEMLESMYEKDELIQLAKEMGYPDSEIKDLL